MWNTFMSSSYGEKREKKRLRGVRESKVETLEWKNERLSGVSERFSTILI